MAELSGPADDMSVGEARGVLAGWAIGGSSAEKRAAQIVLRATDHEPPGADAATSPDETEREQLAEAIDRVIGGWLATHFGIARAAWSLPRPDQMSIEWVGHQALDQAQYLHLAGWQASLTPKLVELIDRRSADLEQLRAELAVLRPIRDQRAAALALADDWWREACSPSGRGAGDSNAQVLMAMSLRRALGEPDEANGH